MKNMKKHVSPKKEINVTYDMRTTGTLKFRIIMSGDQPIRSLNDYK